jgi:hypothetical protein
MCPNPSNKINTTLPWIFAIILTLLILFAVHSLAKLPDEPLWASPALWLENWEFAMGVGLGLPYAQVTAPVMLVLVLAINFWIIKKVLNLLLRLINYLKQNQTPG